MRMLGYRESIGENPDTEYCSIGKDLDIERIYDRTWILCEVCA